MLLITYEISKKLYPNKPLYLEVRTWNIRAVKCYQKAGFRIDGQAYELTTGIGTGTLTVYLFRSIRQVSLCIFILHGFFQRGNAT